MLRVTQPRQEPEARPAHRAAAGRATITPVAHVLGPGRLRVDSRRLTFEPPDGPPTYFIVSQLRYVYCYGQVTITAEAIRLAAQSGVTVVWLSAKGDSYRARIVGAGSPALCDRLRQYSLLANPAARLAVARRVVMAKLEDQRSVARHFQPHGHRSAGILLQELDQALVQASAANTLNRLRGVEGAAARAWYASFGDWLRPPMTFARRTRRPPRDPVNALLSLGYTWLLARVAATAQGRGLELAIGALHDLRLGWPSLACDLVEPLRASLVDRWVVALCNRDKLTPDAFESSSRGVYLERSTFGKVCCSFERHWLDRDGPQRVHAVLQSWVAVLREVAPTLPGGPETAPDPGTSDNSVTTCGPGS